MTSLPKINAVYWVALMSASVFGTNTGDFVADYLQVGHLSGLPYLAMLFAVIFLFDRFEPVRSPIWFWAGIITVRTAATNIGDAFHDFNMGFETSLPITVGAFIASVILYRMVDGRRAKVEGGILVTPLYWVCMMMAGIVGTIGGDYASFGLHLMPPGTAAVFGVIAVALMVLFRVSVATQALLYWLILVVVRTAGTGGGDALADQFQLVQSTLITGAVFVAIIFIAYFISKKNVRPPIDHSGLQADGLANTISTEL